MPDFSYFIPSSLFEGNTHRIVSMFTFSLPLGLLLLLFFRVVGKDALTSLLPCRLEKAAAHQKFRVFDIFACPAAIILGTATHLLWDSFTHRQGYFVKLFPVLGEFYVYKFLQHSSSLAGLLIILLILKKNSKTWFFNKKMLAILFIPLALSVVPFLLTIENRNTPVIYRLLQEVVFTGGKYFLALLFIYSVFYKIKMVWRRLKEPQYP